jgi:hypothetical protein
MATEKCVCGKVEELVNGRCSDCKAIPYDKLIDMYNSTAEEYPTPVHERMGIMNHGKCICCRRIQSSLIYGACSLCREYLGENVGRIARRIRSDVAFAKAFADALPGELKENFYKMYGVPGEIPGPDDLGSVGRVC